MYTIEEIKFLREKALKLQLVGYELLENFTDEELQKICNGIGAEWFPENIRKTLDKLCPSMRATAMIHDLQWYLQCDFAESNKTLKQNGIIEAKAEYPWYHPLRYVCIRRAKVFAELCQKFGFLAYCNSVK